MTYNVLMGTLNATHPLLYHQSTPLLCVTKTNHQHTAHIL